ncbi:hypothetical protein EYF80_034822 [Liparis tanakae]|uniref:Uncharacterized protein n=1 Tax=Liparis tanakae TaxID=230148 RepID=A0A4Z2GQF3_9TELE|nr:hypothetical protein EYF80_034822 [Liparis tanakae]
MCTPNGFHILLQRNVVVAWAGGGGDEQMDLSRNLPPIDYNPPQPDCHLQPNLQKSNVCDGVEVLTKQSTYVRGLSFNTSCDVSGEETAVVRLLRKPDVIKLMFKPHPPPPLQTLEGEF